MSPVISFRISPEDHQKLTEIARDTTPNMMAKQMFLDALYRQDQNTDYTLKVSIRALTIMQRLTAELTGTDRAGEVLALAHEDEKQLLAKVGLSDE